MTFLADAQVPPALARALIAAGHASQHVANVSLLQATGDAIWQYALGNRLAIVTKDEDFAIRRLCEASGPQIVWLRVGNCSNRELLGWFMPLLTDIATRLQHGEVIIEVV